MNVPPVAIAPGAGRVRGMPNFRAAEDLWLAKAYTMTTVNAAIGTDQNATTFWSKIRDAFIVQGGSEGRTACSLQNRFNKAVQPEVNKFIGFLQGTCVSTTVDGFLMTTSTIQGQTYPLQQREAAQCQ